MPIKYKVWVSVERCDEENDEYEDVDMPDILAEFETELAAKVFMSDLLTTGRRIR